MEDSLDRGELHGNPACRTWARNVDSGKEKLQYLIKNNYSACLFSVASCIPRSVPAFKIKLKNTCVAVSSKWKRSLRIQALPPGRIR